MNKQTLAILGLAILTISAITATSFDFDADTITDDENDILLNTSCTALVQTEKNYDVVILGSDSSAAFLVNSFGTTPSTVVSQSIDQSKQQLVIMTDDWVSHNADSSDVFNNILEQGNIVSLFNTSIEWSNIAYPISYPVETPVAYAMVVISGISYCFSELDCSVDEALESLITWTDSKSAENHDILMDAGEHLGTGVETNDTYKSKGYGKTTIRSVCYKLEDYSDEYDYYHAKYYAEMVPNDKSRNSGLDIKSEMSNGMMMTHGPGTTSGTLTATVNTSISIGTDGGSFTIGESWSYAIPDVVVMDRTDTELNILDVRHEVDESRNVGKTTFFAQPGKLIKIDSSETYHSTDTYKTQFCHKSFNNSYNAYNNVSKSYVVQFPEERAWNIMIRS